MTKILEKISLLGLSLLLISAFSISTALPPMLDSTTSRSYTASQVELLVSVPSFSVVAMLLLNPLVDKWLNDRQLIMTGLILLSSAGIFPFFVQLYPLVLLSRLIFGMGIGLINAKAISIISQRYQGKERVQMLGIQKFRGIDWWGIVFSFGWTITENSLDTCFFYLWFWFYHPSHVPPLCTTNGADREEKRHKKVKTRSG